MARGSPPSASLEGCLYEDGYSSSGWFTEEKEAMLRKALALGEELKKFKPHPEDPVPWMEKVSQRVVKGMAEMVREWVEESTRERLDREARERRVKRTQIIVTVLLVVSGLLGFWGVLRQQHHIEKQSRP